VAELPAERRVLITAHDAFGYFGRAYGFEVMGLQGISTTAEAGTADVQRWRPRSRVGASRRCSWRRRFRGGPSKRCRRRYVHAASTWCIGGELYSDALGDAGTPAGTYAGMVRHNVETIVNGLSGGWIAARRVVQ
jgi:manganese/zinc/iron transport system substrate-binding protein